MARVLLVEDSKVQAILAKSILEKAGYTVEHVATGEAAVKACYETFPDIVLQDQHLVEMSGLEVCRRIKNDINLASIPVLVLTAGDKARDHIAALNAGADAFLPKGSPNEQLLAIIARQIEATAHITPSAMNDDPHARPHPARILVVDDSPTFLELLCRKLTEVGFEVASASSGLEGLALLHEKSFDVVVVDVVMPEMDGFEYCQQARQWATENRQQLGLLVLTGADREKVLLGALNAGADDYVSKLQDIDIIQAHVTALTRRIARAKQIVFFNKLAQRVRLLEKSKDEY